MSKFLKSINMKKTILLLLSSVFAMHVFAQLSTPSWSNNAVVYEVNVRQFSQEGTFAKVMESLPRLKELGVDILWLMPVHPIGVVNRKGSLGSYYSVKDYKAIDESYGTEEDFRTLVQKAHSYKIKVIIDWVANHTAWDHQWINEHRDWYVQDSAGNIVTQYDWSDVAKLNYNSTEMRNAMKEAMRYWVDKFDIDGFRCDVAFLVPVDFWNETRRSLEELKPMYMLAEMEYNTDLTASPNNYFTQAFNAAYGWTFMGVTQDMAKGKKNLNDFRREMKENYERFPGNMHKLFFITNHDENSWNGTVTEKYGDDWKLYSALTYTLPQALPLIYSGEEAGLNRRLKFFEKDPITAKEWSDSSRYDWYKTMASLKHHNRALLNNSGSSFTELVWEKSDTSIQKAVYAFTRKSGTAEVTVIINFSNKEVKLKPTNWQYKGGAVIETKPFLMTTKREMVIPARAVYINHLN